MYANSNLFLNSPTFAFHSLSNFTKNATECQSVSIRKQHGFKNGLFPVTCMANEQLRIRAANLQTNSKNSSSPHFPLLARFTRSILNSASKKKLTERIVPKSGKDTEGFPLDPSKGFDGQEDDQFEIPIPDMGSDSTKKNSEFIEGNPSGSLKDNDDRDGDLLASTPTQGGKDDVTENAEEGIGEKPSGSLEDAEDQDDDSSFLGRKLRKQLSEKNVKEEPFWYKDKRFINMTKEEFAEVIRLFNLEDWRGIWEENLNDEQRFAVENIQHKKDEVPVDLEWMELLTQKGKEEGYKKRSHLYDTKFYTEETLKGLEGIDEEIKLLEPQTNDFVLKPPRDWPPRGWKVDPEVLKFIHSGPRIEDLQLKDVHSKGTRGEDEVNASTIKEFFPRWNAFFEQYCDWVRANKARLDRESLILDPQYYPGRRKVGSLARAGSYELPIVEVGQLYQGKVSSINLHEGAFVDFGAVHDGWIGIQEPDWHLLRQFIVVGMPVVVEVMAKRDPYRYRFPIELRFADPDVDELITRRFPMPPVFARRNDMNLEDVARETGRPFIPAPFPTPPFERELTLKNHPYVQQIRKRNEIEQQILDEEDKSGDVMAYNYEKFSQEIEIHKLNVHAARSERMNSKTSPPIESNDQNEEEEEEEEEEEGEEEEGELNSNKPFSRIESEIALYNSMHFKRQMLHFDTFKRDILARSQLGLPLLEPGRHSDTFNFSNRKLDPMELVELDEIQWTDNFSKMRIRSEDSPKPEDDDIEAQIIASMDDFDDFPFSWSPPT